MDEQVTRVFAGIDWAKDEHQLCVESREGEVLLEQKVPHTSVHLAALCDELTEMADGDPAAVAVAIEVSHGIVVETLMDRGFRVHAINPKQLDRFRDRFSMSGAKDDRRDARVLADSLRTDPQAFRALKPENPLVIQLRAWSRMWDELKQERTQNTNRLQAELRRYFPQFLSLGDDIGTPWILALWDRVPSPAEARTVRPGYVQKLLKTHRIRRINATQVLEILRQPAMKTAPGTSSAAQAHIRLIAQRVRLLNEQLKTCRKEMNALIASIGAAGGEPLGQNCEQRDVEIVQSLPGVGTIVLATLLAEAPGPLAQRDYQALRALSGEAPVTKRSGKQIHVVMRRGCNPRLRNAIHYCAQRAVQCDASAKARYNALKQRGHGHARAVRSVADRLLGVLCAMLRDGSTYQAKAA